MVDFKRNIPKCGFDLEKGYANLLSKGFDTLVETFNARCPEELIDRLDMAKKEALEQDKNGNGIASVRFGGIPMQSGARGGRGSTYLLSYPDFTISINPNREWGIVVEYSAAGLWQDGVDKLRDRVRKAILNELEPKTQDGWTEGRDQLRDEHWIRISRADFAFDFYSEKFTAEMHPSIWARVVQHSSSKKHVTPVKGQMYGRGDYLETLTLGKKGSLEVQVYDKGKEITEISGKTWMIKIWEENGYHPPEDKRLKNVWRLEIRMWSEFLRNRKVLTFEQLLDSIDELITEVLYTKRLATMNSNDNNHRRRKMHPLWSMAWVEIGAGVHMLALGRVYTKSREAMTELLEKQAAGIVRSLAVLQYCGNESQFQHVDENDMLIMAQRVWDTARSDPEHDVKVVNRSERYKHLSMAR